MPNKLFFDVEAGLVRAKRLLRAKAFYEKSLSLYEALAAEMDDPADKEALAEVRRKMEECILN